MVVHRLGAQEIRVSNPAWPSIFGQQFFTKSFPLARNMLSTKVFQTLKSNWDTDVEGVDLKDVIKEKEDGWLIQCISPIK